jgi:hypothetical protein
MRVADRSSIAGVSVRVNVSRSYMAARMARLPSMPESRVLGRPKASSDDRAVAQAHRPAWQHSE